MLGDSFGAGDEALATCYACVGDEAWTRRGSADRGDVDGSDEFDHPSRHWRKVIRPHRGGHDIVGKSVGRSGWDRGELPRVPRGGGWPLGRGTEGEPWVKGKVADGLLVVESGREGLK